jgi:hypothetical protein
MAIENKEKGVRVVKEEYNSKRGKTAIFLKMDIKEKGGKDYEKTDVSGRIGCFLGRDAGSRPQLRPAIERETS